MANKGDLKVWHIPQVPMQAFYVNVENLNEAKLVLNVLADYDKFEFENDIKPDYCNVSGLLVYDDCAGEGLEWCDWSDDYGDSIWDVIHNE